MPIVQVKGVANPMQFPDDMDIEDIKAFLQKRFTKRAISGESDALSKVEDTASPYNPSLVDKIGSGIAGGLKDAGLISDNYRAQQIGKNLSAIGEFLPGVGDATAGDDFGRAAASGDKLGMAMAGLGAIPVVGDAVKRGLRATDGGSLKSIEDIDFEFPITHGGGNIEKIKKYTVFDGLFASPGDFSSGGGNLGGHQTTFYPRKGKVMGVGESDIDEEVSYEDTIKWIKNEYPDADDDRIDSLYEAVIKDDFNPWDNDNIFEDYGFDDPGEASWEAQRVRGKFAADHDYDAVAMKDETGISYLIPFNSKAAMGESIE